MFFFVAFLFTTKPRGGGGVIALVDCPLKKNFLFGVPLRPLSPPPKKSRKTFFFQNFWTKRAILLGQYFKKPKTV